ncbi:LemA family protein [Aliiglaciecola sp. LCG003]|uniref:LemA family protein n=1 Tax=Aliiglaciecola sp. LCG003 TaxID=3053655 RepID=UPI002574335D|nr:LemA family protein [Aliiglaciecola sp. LCG003]WJG08603.1 LemA family protein [Aliiglaciecola sp. LCG003]
MQTTTIIGLVILSVLLVGIVVIYNGIITRKNAVERAWAGVITQERQKNKILPELEKVVSQHKEFESSVLTDITRLRSKLTELNDQQIDTHGLADVESLMSSVAQGINIAVEAYPDLKTAGLMDSMMREIAEQQENVGAAIRIFNQNVEAFNAGIEVFPNNMVNGILNKQPRINVFSDVQTSQGFDYKPNL